MVDTKLHHIFNYFEKKDKNSLSEKDRKLLEKLLKYPFNKQVYDLFQKKGFFSVIELDLYAKKSTNEQIDLILSKSIPVSPDSIPVILFLLIKNYPDFVKRVAEYVKSLSKEEKRKIFSSELYGDKELNVLSVFLKDDRDFVSILIEERKVTPDIFKILASSSEPENLFYLANMDYLLKENLHLIDVLLKNPFTPDDAVVKLKQLKYELEMRKKREKELDIVEDDEQDEKEELKYDVELTKDFEEKVDEEIEENLYARILKMNVPQKMKLALKGNKTARSILIKDSNRQIALSVLKNPGITEDEIDRITKNKTTSDYILREISKNREWIKSYPIIRNLLFNPKTPVDISLKLLNRVYPKDLEELSKSREVPNVLSVQAMRLLKQKRKR